MITLDPAAVVTRIQKEAAEYIAKRKEATLIVGLTAGGTRHILGFRSPDAELVPEPQADSIYEIGSFSKVYTASVLAVLEQRGVIALEDPISRHLPSHLRLKPEIAGLTIRQLATHTSGLGRLAPRFYKFVYEDYRTCYLRYRKEDLYQDLEQVELSRPPDTGWEYSIIGLGTLGHILELATGQPYEELLKETICKPLGLKDTGYDQSDEQLERIIHGYDVEGLPLPNWYHDVLLPQGGLRSSMQDMLAFAEANVSGDGTPLAKALSRARQIHTELPVPELYGPLPDEGQAPGREPRVFSQGLGWHAFAVPRGRVSWHAGATVCYQSSLGVCEPLRLGIVSLTSYSKNLTDLMDLPRLNLDWLTEASQYPREEYSFHNPA